jgi:hypothetical protein
MRVLLPSGNQDWKIPEMQRRELKYRTVSDITEK